MEERGEDREDGIWPHLLVHKNRDVAECLTLWGSAMTAKTVEQFKEILLDQVKPDPNQPRKSFDKDSLESLADSIKEHGVKQPILVRVEDAKSEPAEFIIIDGERRWRSARMAGLNKIPCFIENRETDRSFEVAMITNLQRKDLNPVEEGMAYKRLRKECGYSVSRIAELSGRSMATVNTRLALLGFEPKIQEMFASGVLSPVYQVVEALKLLPNERRVEIAQRFVARKTTIAGMSRACAMIANGIDHRQRRVYVNDSDVAAVALAGDEESHIIRQLGMAGRNVNWKEIVEAAKYVCNECPLRAGASRGECAGCAAIQLLRVLVKKKE